MKILVLILALIGAPALADRAATDALNALRAQNNRAAVTYDPRLEAAAAAHANDMARGKFFAHRGSDGGRVGDRVRAQGYRWCFVGENIAVGHRDLAQVMQGWRESRSHRRNMLDRRARAFGLARVSGDYWVMVLGAPC